MSAPREASPQIRVGEGLRLLHNFSLQEDKATGAGWQAARQGELHVTSALNILTHASVTEFGD